MMYNLSRQGLADELKDRALRELKRRDGGVFLQLNYKQTQALKEERFGVILAIIDKRIKWWRWGHWLAGLLFPLYIGFHVYLEFQELSRLQDIHFGHVLLEMLVPLVLVLFFTVIEMTYSLPRVAALERARTLLQIYEEWKETAPSRRIAIETV